MYAVIESGGKQYRVELGAEIQVDRLDVQPGDSITLDRVLLVADGDATAVGRPTVDGASVSAQVMRQERGDKVIVFKYKPKARTRVKKGARADLTRLRIADIAYGGRSAAEDAKASQSQQAAAAREAEKAAAEKAAADQALAATLAAAQATAEADEPAAKARTASRKSPKATETADESTSAEAAPEPGTASSQPEPASSEVASAGEAVEAEGAPEAEAVSAEPADSSASDGVEADGAETDTRKDD